MPVVESFLPLIENTTELEEHIKNRIPFQTTCEAISLCHCKLGDEGVEFLIDNLRDTNNLSVKRLILLNNKLTDRSARKLGEFLSYFPLQELHLSFNSIGDEGGKSLAEALKTNTTLHTLGLYRNNISETGAEKFIEVLNSSNNSILEKLFVLAGDFEQQQAIEKLTSLPLRRSRKAVVCLYPR